MAVDIATLGIKVDATEADKAGVTLDKLAQSGDKAERSAKGLSTTTSALNASLNNTKSATGAAEAGMRRAAGATGDMAERVARLKASVDPLGSALDRVNSELAEAENLFARGAISASEYAQAQATLLARADTFKAGQERANALLLGGASAARLTASEMLNLGRQAQDVGVSIAMGMNPLMILIQQGPQVFDILSTRASLAGTSIKAVMFEVGAAVWTALAPILPIIAGVGLAVGAVAGAFAIVANEAEKGLGDVQKEFGFTEAQMKKLKDEGVDTGYTMGDAFTAFGMTVKDIITDAFGPQIDAVKKWFAEWYDYVVTGAGNAVGSLVGNFIGAYLTIKESWRLFPAAIADASIQAVNHVIEAIERMVNASASGLNSLLDKLPDWARPDGRIGTISLGRMDNPNAGATADLNAIAQTNMARGRKIAGGIADRFGSNMAEARANRLRKAAGDAGDNGGSDRGRERRGANDNAEDEARNFRDQLQQETAEIGKNRIELKMMAAEREAAKVGAGALADEIRASAAAWRDATIANANAEFKRGLADQVEQLRFENSLLGMNAAAREEAVAAREIELRIREQERQGLTVNRDAIAAETAAIIANAKARGERTDAIANAKAATEAVRDMNDALREGVDGFGELFGTAGRGFENLINVMADYDDRQAELQHRAAEADMATAEGRRERERAMAQMASAEIAHYGNMLGAAKGFFTEGSSGYRVLEAAERAYRLFQFAMQIRAMFMDKASTASSVANSGARAAADGVAAIAKAIASLPFPLNLVAGAATAAALVAFGVKVLGGGGKGKSATASASSAAETYSGPRDAYGNPTSSYSVLKPGITVANDNGLAPGGMAPANVGNVTSSPTYHINIEGNADDRTVAQLRQALDQSEDRAVERARAAAAQDRAAASSRQRIGGS